MKNYLKLNDFIIKVSLKNMFNGRPKKEELIKYILRQRKKGIDDYTIETYLLNLGYKKSIVENAINSSYTYNPYSTAEKGSILDYTAKNHKKIIIIAVAIALVLIALFFWISHGHENKAEQKITINAGSPIQKGETLEIELTLNSTEKHIAYPIFYIEGKNRKKILSWRAKDAITKKGKYTIKRKISLEKGSYFLSCVLNFGPERLVSNKIRIEVKGSKGAEKEAKDKNAEKESTANKTPEKENENITEKITKNRGNNATNGNEDSANTTNEPDETAGSRGSSINDIRKITENAKIMAMNDAKKALRLCDEINNTREKDKCCLYVAETGNYSDGCLKISQEERRRECFMYFVNMQDFTVCEKIDLPLIRRTCENYREITLLTSDIELNKTIS